MLSPLTPNLHPIPLWSTQTSRALEQVALLTPHTPSLMQRAGHSVARVAQAIAPHARQAWVLCGPGNNGGDGLVAAQHLAARGLQVWVHWLGTPEHSSTDTLHAWTALQQHAIQYLPFHEVPPLTHQDIVIDALLGLGQHNSPHPSSAPLLQILHNSYNCHAHALAVDIPTGLDADHGTWFPGYAPPDTWQPQSRHTVSLLTLKPGLFTADGRDACGQIWLDDLDCPSPTISQPTAWLNTPSTPSHRRHNSHKGTFGDVLVIGGATSMHGAAILAANAALHHGAGRTLLHLLAPTPSHTLAADIMQLDASQARAQLPHATVVCGCGGGQAIAAWLPEAILLAPRLLLDADALNALAHDSTLSSAVRARRARGQATILTPHPLEAARLLQTSTANIQAQRLTATQTLAQRLQCTVLLKGSGSIIASPEHVPHINPTGNPRLAIGGTGDVLAGLIGARWRSHAHPHQAACAGAWEHGALSDQWPNHQTLTASRLACAQLQPAHL